MVQASASHSADSERAELQTVLADLARTPRLAKLLGYVADKYFEGKPEEIVEYNIATEVFGRSKTTFDSYKDSIARVEAHRLRKRLREYYETEGKDHEIQISLPSGRYVPTFTRRTPFDLVQPTAELEQNVEEPSALPSAAIPDEQIEQDAAGSGTEGRADRASRLLGRRALFYSAAAVAVMLLAAGLARIVSRSRYVNPSSTAGETASNSSPTFTPGDAARAPLRILAGYEGSPRIDSAGNYWLSDQYFHGGAAYSRPDVQIDRTSDPMLFEHWRTGDFSYQIPLAPGPYEMHLFFVTSESEDISLNTFHVDVNWKQILPSFCISCDALGANIADERVFRDIYPSKWGYLYLGFSTERGTPSLSAIELLPGLPHRQLPIRIVMQKTAVTDSAGTVWHPDNYSQGGRASDISRRISGTPDPNLYKMERYGHFTYSIPVDTRDRYTLVLHFAEMYWGPKASGQGGVGSRIFRVFCNGSTLLDNFDIYKEAGSLNALTKTFYHMKPSPEGKLNLTFEPTVNFATVSAIEVIDESQ